MDVCRVLAVYRGVDSSRKWVKERCALRPESISFLAETALGIHTHWPIMHALPQLRLSAGLINHVSSAYYTGVHVRPQLAVQLEVACDISHPPLPP